MKELSQEAQEALKFLGNFGPTVHKHLAEVKGYMLDEEGSGKVYLYSSDLRELADGLNQAADWLDERAKEPQA